MLERTHIAPQSCTIILPPSAGGEGRSNSSDVKDTTVRDITRRKSSFSNLKELVKREYGTSLQEKLRNDMLVLRHIWFAKPQGDDHASRLESFYGPQARACEHLALIGRYLPDGSISIHQASFPSTHLAPLPMQLQCSQA